MKAVAIHCPYCGANVKFEMLEKQKYCFCTHCGQQILLDDEVKRYEVTNREIDEARIHEADAKKQIELEKWRVYEKELAAYEKRKATLLKLAIAWAVILILIVIACIIWYNNTWDEDIQTYGTLCVVGWFLIGEFSLISNSSKEPEKPTK